MLDISFANKVMFFVMFALNLLALNFAFKAKRMILGYRAEFLKAVIYSFLVFSAGISVHFLTDQSFYINNIAIVEHTIILLSFILLLNTGRDALTNREEWGIK